jgi:rRNA-processing protein FCF1
MMTGGRGMKLLEIKDNLGYFLDSQGMFTPVDKITKDDLFRLVNICLKEEVEFDEYNDEILKNQAHMIIYKSIFEKLRALSERRQAFMDESERMYLQEYERYRDKPSQQSA